MQSRPLGWTDHQNPPPWQWKHDPEWKCGKQPTTTTTKRFPSKIKIFGLSRLSLNWRCVTFSSSRQWKSFPVFWAFLCGWILLHSFHLCTSPTCHCPKRFTSMLDLNRLRHCSSSENNPKVNINTKQLQPVLYSVHSDSEFGRKHWNLTKKEGKINSHKPLFPIFIIHIYGNRLHTTNSRLAGAFNPFAKFSSNWIISSESGVKILKKTYETTTYSRRLGLSFPISPRLPSACKAIVTRSRDWTPGLSASVCKSSR